MAEGASVYLTGTRPITGWTVHSGNIWKASVAGDFGELFVDRQRMVAARWPNLTSGDVYRPNFYQATANGGDTAIIDAAHLTQPTGSWTGAKIFMVPGLGWTADQREVTGYDASSHQITFSPAISFAAYYDADQYSLYFLYDKLSLLDVPFEWFLDRATHTVYVWLPDGSDPNAHLVEASGVTGNPLFADAAGNDFSLLAGSPMIDRGTFVAGITDGYAGAAPDIGAYERGGSEQPGPRYKVTWLTFTDDPLVARTTPAKAIHLSELRVAVNKLRTGHGLSAYAWTDVTLSAGGTSVRAVHLTELRTALDAVYLAMGRTPPTYTGATITPGTTVITSAHIAELRAAVLAIW